MWGFLLNSSRLFMDFRKIKYAMPCNAMHPMQDYFWKVFYMHGKLICNLYALLYWQNFILVKCGCFKPTPLIGISPSRFKKRSEII
jgi:hypothetical protein